MKKMFASHRLPELLQDRRAFAMWLAKQGRWSVVGVTKVHGACPVAQFLKAEGLEGVVVATDLCEAVDKESRALVWTPQWLRSFILKVDDKRNINDQAVAMQEIRQFEAALALGQCP
jgi:hypothetical protein